jgi:small subunit ribosomal protein S17
MKIFNGKVIANKMEKTATVAVERIVAHPVYKKRVRRIKKYHVHDTFGTQPGQKVKFIACRPFSKLKRWKIISVVDLEKKKQPIVDSNKKKDLQDKSKIKSQKSKLQIKEEKKAKTKNKGKS